MKDNPNGYIWNIGRRCCRLFQEIYTEDAKQITNLIYHEQYNQLIFLCIAHDYQILINSFQFKTIQQQWRFWAYQYGFHYDRHGKLVATGYLPDINQLGESSKAKPGEKVCSISGCTNKAVYSRNGGICRNHNKSMKRKEKRNERKNIESN